MGFRNAVTGALFPVCAIGAMQYRQPLPDRGTVRGERQSISSASPRTSPSESAPRKCWSPITAVSRNWPSRAPPTAWDRSSTASWGIRAAAAGRWAGRNRPVRFRLGRGGRVAAGLSRGRGLRRPGHRQAPDRTPRRAQPGGGATAYFTLAAGRQAGAKSSRQLLRNGIALQFLSSVMLSAFGISSDCRLRPTIAATSSSLWANSTRPRRTSPITTMLSVMASWSCAVKGRS